jgi:hypothetical protein
MEPAVEVTISIDDKVVTFKGPRDFVDAEVARYIGYAKSSNTKTNIEKATTTPEVKAQLGLTEEQLVMEKQPKGHSETVAVLAFALAEAGHPEFSEEDMRRAYIRAKVKPPKVVGQAIRDAKNSFEYIESGTKWGSYKLSHHGERTVRFDLPRRKEAH